MNLGNYHCRSEIYFRLWRVSWGKDYENEANQLYKDTYFHLLWCPNWEINPVLSLQAGKDDKKTVWIEAEVVGVSWSSLTNQI